MTMSERLLRAWLRIMGTVTGLAVVAVFMPRAWMDPCGALAGLDRLPDAPIFEYLARSLSAFYAMMGGLAWMASFDVRRHAWLILYLAVGGLVFAPVIFIIDMQVGMPRQWTFHEAPVVLVSSVVMLVLQRMAGRGAAP